MHPVGWKLPSKILNFSVCNISQFEQSESFRRSSFQENKTWRLSSDSKTTPPRHSAACYQLRWMCQYSTALPASHLSSNFFFTTDEKHLIVYFQLRSKSLDKTTWLECQLAHNFLFSPKSLHDFDLISKLKNRKKKNWSISGWNWSGRECIWLRVPMLFRIFMEFQ